MEDNFTINDSNLQRLYDKATEYGFKDSYDNLKTYLSDSEENRRKFYDKLSSFGFKDDYDKYSEFISAHAPRVDVSDVEEKAPYEEWYKTVPPERANTDNYDLKRAYELLPMEQLERWRTASDEDLEKEENHLPSVAYNEQADEYEFLKGKDHPTLQKELDWYNSDDPEAVEFRKNYRLDDSGDRYRYVRNGERQGKNRFLDKVNDFIKENDIEEKRRLMYNIPNELTEENFETVKKRTMELNSRLDEIGRRAQALGQMRFGVPKQEMNDLAKESKEINDELDALGSFFDEWNRTDAAKAYYDEQAARCAEMKSNIDQYANDVRQKRIERQREEEEGLGFWGRLGRSLSSAENPITLDVVEAVTSPEENNIRVVKNELRNARLQLERERMRMKGELGGLAFVRGIKTANYYELLPVIGMADAATLLALKKDIEDGKELTPTQKMLYDAMEYRAGVDLAYQDNNTILERLGMTAPEQMMFTLQFVIGTGLTGATKLGEKAAAKQTEKYVSRYANNIWKKVAEEQGIKGAAKYARKYGEGTAMNFIGTRVVPGLEGMAVSSAIQTFGNPSSLANIAEEFEKRYAGDIYYDDNGNLHVFDNDRSAGQSAYQAVASVWLSNFTEYAGPNITKSLKLVDGKLFDLAGKFDKVMKRIGASKIQDVFKIPKELGYLTQINSAPEEFFEEELENGLTAIMATEAKRGQSYGDAFKDAVSTSFSGEQQLETFLSCAITSMLLGGGGNAVNAVGNSSLRRQANKDVSKAQALLEKVNGINVGELDGQIENGSIADISNYLKAQSDANGWSKDEQGAAVNYVLNKARQIGIRYNDDTAIGEAVAEMRRQAEESANRWDGNIYNAIWKDGEGEMQQVRILNGRVHYTTGNDGSIRFDPYTSSGMFAIQLADGSKKQVQSRSIVGIESVMSVEEQLEAQGQTIPQMMMAQFDQEGMLPTVESVWGGNLVANETQLDNGNLTYLGQDEYGRYAFQNNNKKTQKDRPIVYYTEQQLVEYGLSLNIQAAQQAGDIEAAQQAQEDLDFVDEMKTMEAPEDEKMQWDVVKSFSAQNVKFDANGDIVPDIDNAGATATYLQALSEGSLENAIASVDQTIAKLGEPQQVEATDNAAENAALNNMAATVDTDKARQIDFYTQVRNILAERLEGQREAKNEEAAANKPVSQMEVGQRFPVEFMGQNAVAEVTDIDAYRRRVVRVTDQGGNEIADGIKDYSDEDWQVLRDAAAEQAATTPETKEEVPAEPKEEKPEEKTQEPTEENNGNQGNISSVSSISPTEETEDLEEKRPEQTPKQPTIPTKEVNGKKKGEKKTVPDWYAVKPEQAFTYIGTLPSELAKQLVDNGIKEANDELDGLNKKQPQLQGTDIIGYNEEMQKWNDAKKEAQRHIDYWNEVKAMREKEVAAAPSESPAEPVAETSVQPIVNDGNGGFDDQGNVLNSDGSVFTEKVNSIDEITDDDFDNPQRSIELPQVPDNVANAIGTNGRPVIIKKNIFGKNGETHVDLDPSDSREILSSALYNPNLVGQTQPKTRPDYKVAIRTGDKNSVVVLDIYEDKNQVDIVGWRRVNEKGLEKMKKQAEREGGQFLILSPEDGSAAALSALPQDLNTETSTVSEGKDNAISKNVKGNDQENLPPTEETPVEPAPTKPVNPSQMSDEELLQWMEKDGNGDVNKAENMDVYDEYDSRHTNEYLEEFDKAKEEIAGIEAQIEEGNTEKNDDLIQRIADIYDDAEKEWDNGGSHSDQRTRLSARMAAADEWLDKNVRGEGEESVTTPTEAPKVEPEKPKSKKKPTRFQKRIDAVGDARSVEEAILLDIATGGAKFRWGNRASDTKAAKRGIGDLWKYGQKEMRSKIGIIKKDGFSVETYAEAIQQGQLLPYGITDGMVKNMDSQELIGIIENVLQMVNSKSDALDIVERRRQDEIDEEQRYIRSVQDDEARARGFEDWDDYTAYQESFSDVSVTDEDYYEINAKFAEQYQEEYERQQRAREIESETDSAVDQLDEQQGVHGEGEGGDNLLQGEQTPDTGSNQRPGQGENIPAGNPSDGTPPRADREGEAEVRAEIDKLKAQRANIVKQRNDIQQRYEQASGLFGDTQADKNDLFGGQNFLSPELAQATIDGYNKKIKQIDDEIKRLESSLERAKEVTQTEIGEGEIESSTPKPRTTAKIGNQKIDDVGEKIGGARKDLAQKLSGKINLEAGTFPKMFPKFDLKKLVEQGLDPKLASTVQFLRQAAQEEYKSKLKRRTKENALAGAKFFAAYAKQVLENADTNVDFTDSGWAFTDYGKAFVTTNIALYDKIHEMMGDDMFDIDLSGYEIQPVNVDGKLNYTAYRRTENGEEEKFTPYYEAKAKGGTTFFKKDELDKAIDYMLGKIEKGVSYAKSHPYKISVYYNKDGFFIGVNIKGKVIPLTEKKGREETVSYFNEHNAELQAEAARVDQERKEEKKTERPVAKIEQIYADQSKGFRGGYVFAVKLGKEYARIMDEVFPLKDIYKYLSEHKDELQEKAQQMLDQYLDDVEKSKGWKPQLNLGGGRTRVGEDYRQGRDIGADEFRDAFGFRGVEFGNYVTQKERQRFMNEAYDALMDLADLIGVSPKALSLGGQLGFAIGARGGGGKNAAHYEPELNVINLTKTQGAGSLAHEWWHALDYYFNREGDKRKKSATAVTEAGDFSEGVRKEMRNAFLDLMERINGSEYYERSKALERKLHPGTIGTGYFDKPTELGARAFQDYVMRRLTDRGQVNDFLSSFTPEEQWNGEAKNYPYPTGKDADAIDEKFDKLFGTMEERQDEHGNLFLYEPEIEYNASKANNTSEQKVADKQLSLFLQNNSDEYETQDGEKVEFASLKDYGDQVQTGGTTAADGGTGADGLQRERDTQSPTDYRLRKLEKGETCHVERRYTEFKQFDFTGSDKIDSIDDVAYIFKKLEDEAIENSFIVLVKDGKPTIIHTGIGSYTQTIVNANTAMVAYKNIDPDKVYFVHNHPSGSLKCSRPDVEVYKKLKALFGDNLEPGIIIDLTSGQYGTFTDTENVSRDMPSNFEGEIPLKTYSFSKQVFEPDWNPSEAFKVKEPKDVASFISSQRLGKHKKMGLIVVNNQNQVVGNIFLPYTDISEVPEGIGFANEVAYYVNQMGCTAAVVFGNYKLSGIDTRKVISALKDGLSKQQLTLLDFVHVGEGYGSAAMEGYLVSEEREPYNAIASDSGVSDRDREKIRDEFDRITGAHPSEKAKTIHQKWEQFMTDQFNKFRPLKQLEGLLEKQAEKKGRKLLDSESVYSRATMMTARTLPQMEAEKSVYTLPLEQAVNSVFDILDPDKERVSALPKQVSKESARKMDELRQRLADYLIAKHGLERNEWFEQNGKDEGDYSGLKGLAESLGENPKNYKAVAERVVSEFENEVGTQGIDELWNAINTFTNRLLELSYSNGFSNKEHYEDLKGRWKHYVPLRGFAEGTSDDLYYYTTKGSDSANPNLKAEGRTSKPDDPLVHLVRMQENAVVSGNENWAKLALLNAARNLPNDLLRVKEVWYTEDPATGEIVEHYPDTSQLTNPDEIDAAIKKFNSDMKAAGAKQRLNKADVGKKIRPQNLSEHEVEVYENGKKVIIEVNGNPSLVRAYGESQRELSGFVKGVAKANRLEARLFTSWNPEFAVKNMMRDANFALFSAFVTSELGEHKWMKTRKNIDLSRRVLPHLMKDGKVGPLVKDASLRANLEKWYKEFIDNGGETGFTRTMTAEQLSEDISDTLRALANGREDGKTKVEKLFGSVETLNRWAENSTRFAAYITARESGKSVRVSMDEAKNSTLNFNIKGYKGQGFRAWWAFYNARLQGVAQLARLALKNPKRFLIGLGAAVLTGAIVQFYNILSLWLFGNKKDWITYEEQTEYKGNNNLVIFIPGIHKWVSIPYSQELAPFSALGNIWFREAVGWNRNKSAWQQELEMALAYLPMEINLSDKKSTMDFWASTLGRSAAPTILQPAVEYMFNENFMNVPLRRDNQWNTDMAAWTKAYENRTSKSLISLSKFLNGGSATNKWGKAEFLIDPTFIQHVIEGTAGGVGSFMGNTRDLFTEPDWFNHLPFVRKFMFDSDPKMYQGSIDRAYNKYAYDFVDEQDQRVKAIMTEKNETKDFVKQYMAEHDSTNTAIYNVVKDYSENLFKDYGKKNGHKVVISTYGDNPYRKKTNGTDDLPITGIKGLKQYYNDLRSHDADQDKIDKVRGEITEYEMQMIEEIDAIYYRDHIQGKKPISESLRKLVDWARKDAWQE